MVHKGRQIVSSRLAKLTPPHLPVVLNRTRLFRLLDHATRSPLTWVEAPPGAGKTTLLASYATRRHKSLLWYRLDAGDADPAAFFHYLGLAVQVAAPRFRKPLPHLTPEYFAGLPIFTQRFFEALGARCHRPTAVVFDNYHEVPSESSLHQLLPVGLQRLPPHVRVVILSREPYPSSYIRLAAEQQLQTIPTEELELTRAEAHQVYELQKTRRKKSVTTTSIDQLWELARGWMAGFVLLLERGAERDALSHLCLQANPQAVFEYLAGEVMHGLPVETQQVLITMSLVPDFTPNMAVEMTDRSEAGQVLEQLHQSRYFIERREDRIGWYRFHPLLQKVLLRRAEQTLNHQTIQGLRRKAATLLVEVHREEDAITLLQQAQAWDDYRAIIRGQAQVLVQQGRMQTLQTWIQHMPDVEREADPWMDFWVANCRLLAAPQEATPLFESVMMRFQQQEEQRGMLLAWAGAAQSILMAGTGMKRIHDLMRLFEKIHPEGTAYPSLEVEAVVTQAMAGCYVFMCPDRPQAREWLDRAVGLLRMFRLSVRGSEIVMLTFYYILLGEGDKAQALFSHQQRVWANDTSVATRLMLMVTEVTFLCYSGQVEVFRDAVQKSLELAEREGILVWNGPLYALAAHIELMVGNTEAARSYLKRMLPFSRFGANRKFHLTLSAWADLVEGDIDQVWQKCRQSWEVLEAEGFPIFLAGGHYLVESQALRSEGRQTEAEQMLAKVEVIGKVLPWYFTFSVLFLRAQWAFQDGDDDRGTLWLRRLVEEGKRSPLIGVGLSPQQASQVFAKALEYEIEVPYAREVISKWQLKPPVDGPIPENWPWRVKVWTFGKLVVEVDGKPLEKQRKTSHRLMELLVAIITFGGHDVPVSRLIDALWPEADGDTGHENFKKSIARLRKLLAVNEVIRWEDGKISLNPDLSWVDVLVFERHVKREDVRAIRLYTGPWLGLEELPLWAESQRERMRTTFIRLVSRHCDHVPTTNKVEETIRSLEQAIAVDPLAEPLYHRLIPLLIAQGRRADAQRHYQTCVKACQQWKDGELSEDILRLGQSLTL